MNIKISLFLAYFFIPLKVVACLCDSPFVVKEANTVDIIFEGRVVDIKLIKSIYNDSSDLLPNKTPSFELTFELINSWKGINKEKIKVRTEDYQVGCGINFEKSKTYIVFAYADNNQFITSTCNNTIGKEDIIFYYWKIFCLSLWKYVLFYAVFLVGIIILYKKRNLKNENIHQ